MNETFNSGKIASSRSDASELPATTKYNMTNTELLEQYRATRLISDPKLLAQLRSPLQFSLYKMTTLPMAFMAGIKVKQVDLELCQITVPYRWLNQNPFR